MKSIVFAICLSAGLVGFSADAFAQQDAQHSSVMSAKKEKARKAGTENNDVISSSPMAAKKKRNIQRPANDTAPTSSGSVMSAGKSPREAK